jgi:hypothetical protein
MTALASGSFYASHFVLDGANAVLVTFSTIETPGDPLFLEDDLLYLPPGPGLGLL